VGRAALPLEPPNAPSSPASVAGWWSSVYPPTPQSSTRSRACGPTSKARSSPTTPPTPWTTSPAQLGVASPASAADHGCCSPSLTAPAFRYDQQSPYSEKILSRQATLPIRPSPASSMPKYWSKTGGSMQQRLTHIGGWTSNRIRPWRCNRPPWQGRQAGTHSGPARKFVRAVAVAAGPARPAGFGGAWPRRSGGVRRYARRASSSRTGWAMPGSCTCPSSTKVTPWGAFSATRSLTRTRLALA
jgi:hypothetical protein